MAHGPLVVSFVGASGSGKTTVIEQLVPLLRAAGLRVGTVKHASHGHDVDKPGSDSWRHRRAGAEAVLLAGASGVVLFLEEGLAALPAQHHTEGAQRDAAALRRIGELVAQHLTDVDVVLAEGFAPVHDLLVQVERADVRPKRVVEPGAPWVTVTDTPSGDDQLGFDELGGLAARIVARVRG